jgi:hypothetical protein
MRIHILVVSAVIWILLAGTAFAQTFTGTLDGYWSYNTNRTGFNQDLQSFTATAQFPWSDLTLWTEYRRDWSTEAVFNKTQGEDSSVRDNQNTITFGLTYVFETAR